MKFIVITSLIFALLCSAWQQNLLGVGGYLCAIIWYIQANYKKNENV